MAAPPGMSPALNAPGGSPGRQRFVMPVWWKSMGFRLLAAFLGISGLSALAVGMAFYFFTRTDAALANLLGTRMPEAMEVLELSRKVENIVVVAPTMLGAVTDEQRVGLSQRSLAEIDRASLALRDLIDHSDPAPSPAALAAARYHDWIRSINVQLDQAVAHRLMLERRRNLGRSELKRAADGLRALFEPSFRVLYVLTGAWQSTRPETDITSLQSLKPLLSLGDDIVKLFPQRQAYEQVTDLEHRIADILLSDTPHETLERQLIARQALADAHSIGFWVPDHAKAQFSSYLGWIETLVDGPDNLAELQRDWLWTQGHGRVLLATNEHIADLLGASLDRLVVETRLALTDARIDLQQTHAVTAMAILQIRCKYPGHALPV